MIVSFANNLPSFVNKCQCPMLAREYNINCSNTWIITSNKTRCLWCLGENNNSLQGKHNQGVIKDYNQGVFARGQTNSIMNNVRNNYGIHSGFGYNKHLLILRYLYNRTLGNLYRKPKTFNMDRSFVNSPNTSLVAK